MGCEVVDAAFIPALEHRPKPIVSEAGEVPLIDLSPLNNKGDPEALSGLISQIEDACRDWGFFQVINHGVPVELLEGIQSVVKEFFALSTEEKRKVKRNDVNPLGYYDSEHTKNVRDWKEVFDFAVNEAMKMPEPGEHGVERLAEIKNQWPEYPPQLRELCMEYSRDMETLAYTLLELISISLKLPAKRLNGFFEDSTSFIRFNYYPPCPAPDLALGVGHHKDSGALTVLYQDEVGGLDVKRKSDGEWVRVKPIPNAYIINVGDIIQVWSNDRYESVEHRVSVNSQKARLSIPFFFNPTHNTVVRPLEELTDELNPSKYDEYNWGEFFKTRKNSDFKKLGVENIQIHHFKKTL